MQEVTILFKTFTTSRDGLQHQIRIPIACFTDPRRASQYQASESTRFPIKGVKFFSFTTETVPLDPN